MHDISKFALYHRATHSMELPRRAGKLYNFASSNSIVYIVILLKLAEANCNIYNVN